MNHRAVTLPVIVAVLVLVMSTGAVASAAPAVPSLPAAACPAVEAVAVRASTERPGPGLLPGAFVEQWRAASSQPIGLHALDYPATMRGYRTSAIQGVTALRAHLLALAVTCPSTSTVLIGHSQGADVIGDVLAAGRFPGSDRVRAAVFFGDPTFRGRAPYNAGSFRPDLDGIFARPVGALDRAAATIRSYCNADDEVCQRGGNGGVPGHLRYQGAFADALAFVRARVGG